MKKTTKTILAAAMTLTMAAALVGCGGSSSSSASSNDAAATETEKTESTESSVDLPVPFLAIKPTFCPSAMEKLISSKSTSDPNDFVRF